MKKLFNMLLKEIDSTLEIEVMKSERFRAKLVMGIILFILISIILRILSNNSEVHPNRLDMFIQNSLRMILVFCIFLSYEIFFHTMIGVLLRNHKKMPLIARYGNAIVETSLPTASLVIFGFFIKPAEILYSPPTYAYMLFILLSVLRLDFKLSLFTGFIAAIEYYIVLFYYYDKLEGVENMPMLYSQRGLAIKGMIFIFGGLLAGLVARQIHLNVVRSINSINEKNQILSIFGQHVSQSVVEKLMSQDQLKDSEMRHVCIMFLDIRNFTAFSESRSPVEVVDYLNSLFSFMIDIINKHHGIINKFLGDGFMAVFGAPFSDGRDCENAMNASKEIFEKIKIYHTSGDKIPTKIGIGLHSGDAVTGNVGSDIRKEYTIIGDVVNLASRLEQLNKEHGTQILFSESVANAIQNYHKIQKLGDVKIKGKSEPVSIYTMLEI